MKIKELENNILKLKHEEFEEFINEMYMLNFEGDHVYDKVQTKDGGADGYSKSGQYVLACYAPKIDRKLNKDKIYIDIIKHIKWVYVGNYKLSRMYIKSTNIARTNSVFPFNGEEFRIKNKKGIRNIEIVGNKFIDNNIKLFSHRDMPAEVRKFYIDNNLIELRNSEYVRKKSIINILFEYNFVENLRNEWCTLMNSPETDFRLKVSIFNRFFEVESIILKNKDSELESLSQQIKRKVKEEMQRLDIECTYTKFLKSNYPKINTSLKYISDYIHLEELQDKRGTYLGYSTEIKTSIEEIKERRILYRDNSLIKREVFETVYNEEDILKIDEKTNTKIYKGVCAHIGSDLSDIFKENGGIDWNE